MDINETVLAIIMVRLEADVTHAFIDNMSVLVIVVANETVELVGTLTTVGEEGTRKGRGAVISLTSHENSG